MLLRHKVQSIEQLINRCKIAAQEGKQLPPYLHYPRIEDLTVSERIYLNQSKRIEHELEEASWISSLMCDTKEPPAVIYDMCSGLGFASFLSSFFLKTDVRPYSKVFLLDLRVPELFNNLPGWVVAQRWDARRDELPVLGSDKRAVAISIHPCGNMASEVIRVFLKAPDVTGLIIVPCCCPAEHKFTLQQCLPLNTTSHFSAHSRLKQDALAVSKLSRKSLLIIMAGLPGAGKTYLAGKIVEGLEGEDVAHIEYDRVPQGSFQQMQDTALSQVEIALQRHEVVIADDNAFYPSIRKRLSRLATGGCFIQIYVDTPADICWSRNQCRPVDSRISRESFDRILDRLQSQPPSRGPVLYFYRDLQNNTSLLLDQIRESWHKCLHDVTPRVFRADDECKQQPVKQHQESQVRRWISERIKAEPVATRAALAKRLDALKKQYGSELSRTMIFEGT